MVKNRNRLFRYAGIAVIAGCLFALFADILGILVYEDHNPVRQTISQLAHGKYAYIQDIGLLLFGLGILAAGTALYVWKPKSAKWQWGSILLIIMGVCVGVLAEFNDFAGEPGTTIHIVLAVLIGILFAVCTFVLGMAFKKISKNWYAASIGIGTAFLLACSGFLFISKAYEGAYERGVALLVLLWFIIMGYHLTALDKAGYE